MYLGYTPRRWKSCLLCYLFTCYIHIILDYQLRYLFNKDKFNVNKYSEESNTLTLEESKTTKSHLKMEPAICPV